MSRTKERDSRVAPNSRVMHGMRRRTTNILLALFFGCFSTSTSTAQVPYIVDSSSTLSLLQTMLPYLVWPESSNQSAVAECQQVVNWLCVAEHSADEQGGPLRFAAYDAAFRRFTSRVPFRLDRLLPPYETLAGGAASAADNGWYVGQLALVALRVGIPDSAFAAVRQCKAVSWWCTALAGYVYQTIGLHTAADSSFRVAVAEMPADLRCRWEDISVLLPTAAAASYAAMDCTERQVIHEEVWWYADPLLMDATNERRSEHLARRVLDSLMAGGASPLSSRDQVFAWDSSLSAVLMRYGYQAHFVSPASRGTGAASNRWWVHVQSPSYSFVPHATSLTRESRLEPSAWSLFAPLDSALERYHPSNGTMHDLKQYQVAMFRRGDSAVVVATLAVDEELIEASPPFATALILSARPGRGPGRFIESESGRVLLVDTIPAAWHLLGLEATSEASRVSARVRFSVDASRFRGSPGISDLLLIDPIGPLPKSLHEALPIVRHSPNIGANERLGIYFETYDIPRAQDIVVQLTLRPTIGERVGLIGKVARALGLAVGTPIASVAFQLGRGDDAGHSLEVGMSGVESGKYSLEVEITAGDGAVYLASTPIQVGPARKYPSRPRDRPAPSKSKPWAK